MKGFSTTHPPVLGPIFNNASQLRLCDIGPNIKSDQFYGKYHGKRSHHKGDVAEVIDRAQSMGVCSMVFTGSDVKNSAQTLAFCNNYPPNNGLFCTAGIHPTRSILFENECKSSFAMNELTKLIEAGLQSNRLVALGEMGLDYDRLHCASKATQLLCFERQLQLATQYDLPLFLHSRNAATDFAALLGAYRDRLPRGGVVHCFTGSLSELQHLVEMGFYIGLTGASLRTEEGLVNATAVPDHLLLLETDSPYCGIKKSHPSFKYVDTIFPTRPKEKHEAGVLVEGRNEPCTMVQVLEVVAKLRNRDPLELAEQVYANTEALFYRMREEEK